MKYNGKRLFVILERKFKDNGNRMKNTVEMPQFKIEEGINYVTFVKEPGLQGRFFYITKQEIMQYKKPTLNTSTTGAKYQVYSPPLSLLLSHEIDINDINLDGFTEEPGDRKSSYVKEATETLWNIIKTLKENGRDINGLPLNKAEKEEEKEEKEEK